MVGFIGGMCGMAIALSALRMFFVKHYMRYSKTKDYLELDRKIKVLINELTFLTHKVNSPIFVINNEKQTNE